MRTARVNAHVYARVNQTTIACRLSGTGEGTLLLLHGAMISHTDWEPQEEAFGAHYNLLMPDIRGHGFLEHCEPRES
jgi:3-oxoadipate enol-lactonase